MGDTPISDQTQQWQLTPRQWEVLELIAKGFTNPDIARLLNISLGTVKSHVAAIISELDVSNRTEAAVFYNQNLSTSESNATASVDKLQPDTVSTAGTHSTLNMSSLSSRPENKETALPKSIDSTNFVLPSPITLAILPFDDISEDRSQSYFADGITEEVICSLAKQPELRVVARTSAFAFRGKQLSVQEIGKKLNVWGVLEGSIRLVNDQLRVNVQLVSCESGFSLWSDVFHRHMSDVLKIQEDIAQALTKVFKIRCVNIERPDPAQSEHSLEAYQLFWQGRFYWNLRTPQGVMKSVECFQQVLALEPQYTLAYVGLSDAFNQMGAYATVPPSELFTQAKAYAQKAIALDDQCAEAIASFGYGQMYYDMDFVEAERTFKHSLALNPGYAFSYGWLSLLYLMVGKLEESEQYAVMGKALDPMSVSFVVHMGHIYRACGKLEQAIQALNQGLDMDPTNSRAMNWLALCLCDLEQYQQALSLADTCVDITQGHPLMLGSKGYILACSNNVDAAKALLQQLLTLQQTTYISPFAIALIYIGLEDNDNAFLYLKKSLDERVPLIAHLKTDPIFDKLRHDSRYASVISTLGLPA